MRAEDLGHQELLELDPEGGTIRFAGQRALLLDAVAMGVLRQYLIENFGRVAARAVLTQFGFAHGWRMAEAMQREFGWANNAEWRRAGPRIHTLAGLFVPQPGSEDPLSEEGSMLLASYEAEQHLIHFGQSDSSVCWTICGLMSGYLSRTTDEEIYVLEDRCVGAGSAACHLLGRTRADWGDERAEDLAFFKKGSLKECLDVSLSRITETLKDMEETLRGRQKGLSLIIPDIVDLPFGIIINSAKMKSTVDVARRVAKVDASVLITGESGVGKERIARLIHEESARSGGPFIAVNCGAITESLLESELFGHVRGAFTGATSDRHGLFEAANHGTLLLDEIGEVSPAMQVKLLRVLQEREIRRVGENKVRHVDVRVLAATNRDLLEEVGKGRLREDLYYRLKVVELAVPPLRDRRNDILPLARLFLAEAGVRMGRTISGFTPRAADHLVRYRWPGNVRELQNVAERAVALSLDSRIDVEDLPEELRVASLKPVSTQDKVQSLLDVEQEHILAVLALNEGNQTRTAEQLQIGSATLYRKLKKYDREKCIPERRASIDRRAKPGA